MIDIIELTQRMEAVHAGTLPQDAVSDEELRAALDQLRATRRKKATEPGAVSSPRSAGTPTLAPVRTGGLLAMAAAADAEDAAKN